MSQPSPKTAPLELVLAQLRHPLKLRLVLCVTIVAAWSLLFFVPLGDQTQVTTARIARERKRIATAREIDTLKKALAPHHGLVPAGANLNDLMRGVIDHLRSSPLKLIDLKPEAPKDLGPFETIGVQLALEGQFAEIDTFLTWVETDGSRLRIDSIKIDPNLREPGRLKAQLTLLSLAEKPPVAAKTKPETDKAKPAKTVE